MPALIFGVALAVRLVFLLEVSGSPFFKHRGVDAAQYHQWAVAFGNGTWPAPEPFFWPPLYPFWLGVLYKVVGQDPAVIKVVQAVLGSGTCVLVLLIGRALFSGRFVPVVGALLCCFYGPLFFFDAQLLPGSLDVFLSVLSLWLLLLAGRRRWIGWWALAGASIGLSAINRGWILLTLPVALVWAWMVLRGTWPPPVGAEQGAGARAFWPRALALLVPVGLVVFPVTWHNARYDMPSMTPLAVRREGRPLGETLRRFACGGFAFLSYNAGVNFYLGNHWDLRDRLSVDHPDCFPEYDRVFFEPMNKGLTTAEQMNDYLVGQTLRQIAAKPGDWAKAIARKAFQLIDGDEIPRDVSIYADRRYSTSLSVLLWKKWIAFPGGILLPLGLVGVVLACARWREHWLALGFLAVQAVFVVAFFVTARYRLPMIPLLALYAAYAVWRMVDLARGGDPLRLATPVALLAGLLVLCNAGIGPMEQDHRAFEYVSLGNAQGPARPDQAMACYRRAMQIDPSYAAGWNQSGTLLLDAGRVEEAIGHFRQALKLQPDYAQAHSNLAHALASLGQWPEAMQHFRLSVQVQQDRPQVFNNAALALAACPVASLRDGRRALLLAQKACVLTDYRVPECVDTLGIAYAAVGDFPQAIQAAQRAARLAESSGRHELVTQINRRLELYRAGVPYYFSTQSAPER